MTCLTCNMVRKHRKQTKNENGKGTDADFVGGTFFEETDSKRNDADKIVLAVLV